MAHPWTRQDKFRRGIWAVAFAAVVFVGSLTGAQIKTDKQKEKAINEFRQITPSEQIAILETQKIHLMQQKAGMDRKLDLFRERVREREAEKSGRSK